MFCLQQLTELCHNVQPLFKAQFRLRFAWENNDNLAEYLSLASGDNLTAANRPMLIVYYNP